MKNHRRLPVAFVGAGVGATAGFVWLARSVNAHDTQRLDGRARKTFPKRRRRGTRIVAQGIEPLGKWWGQMPVAAALTALTWRTRGRHAALPIAGASASAAALAWILERAMPRREPPPGRHSPTEPAFPSGHALQVSALALTAAYVFRQEYHTPRTATASLAVLLPVASGLAKLYLDKHWFTDVLGGYLLGVAVAAPAVAAYDIARPRRRRWAFR
jgi:undecaprenyl-diphosphatase